MQELRVCEGLLADLGSVIHFPADAAQALADAERDRALARHGLSLRRAEAERLQAQLSAIDIDHGLLRLADSIEALETSRHQYSAHASNIARSQGQAALLWQEIQSAAGELGWRLDDAAKGVEHRADVDQAAQALQADRKSTRLNSSQ